MTLEDLAVHYAKYWSQNYQGEWILADNAPADFWKFMVRSPADRQMIHAALAALATGKAPDTPDTVQMLRWFADNPEKLEHFKPVLRDYKTVPRDIEEVIAKAYKKELFSVFSDVQMFLTHEMNRY